MSSSVAKIFDQTRRRPERCSVVCALAGLALISVDSACLSADAATNSIKQGEQVYRDYCASCHGSSAINVGRVPDLRRSNPEALAALDSIVLGGLLSPRGMPSFAKVLSRADVAALQAYLSERARLLQQ
jgi:mono/diheme cytochrome c family protein